MDDNITKLDVATRKELDPNVVLDEAKAEDLDAVVVIGFTKDNEMYLASSCAENPKYRLPALTLTMIRIAEHELMQLMLEEE